MTHLSSLYRRRNLTFAALVSVLFPSLLLSNLEVVSACPQECVCNGKIVLCNARGLTHIPRNIPKAAERIDLQQNNITQIHRMDFAGLRRLRKLQLSENLIASIHERAFDDLDSLRSLQLDNNQISCLYDRTFKSLKKLEVLTLNRNNITHLSFETLQDRLSTLRIFRMHNNPIRCDCHLAWLAEQLKRRPAMALFTRCYNPVSMRGVYLAGASLTEFTCSEASAQNPPSCAASACPAQCSCNDRMVDCRAQGLTMLPVTFPSDVTELRLEENGIEVIPAYAFSSYPNLRRIDLSNNNIREIEENAFQGLSRLSSLVLYGNEITSLPKGVFQDLRSLQLLLLNANKLTCLRQDAFRGLSSLSLLSLYNNKLQSLARGTFDPLRSIEILHLARNPFICDCNLKWLAKYLKKHPIETSGARCAGPRKMVNKKISLVKSKRYRCTPDSSRAFLSTECTPEAECPSNCQCEGATVDCSAQGLTAIPDNIPPYASELILRNNQIEIVTNSGAFKKLRNLKKIDLSNNQLVRIEDGAFSGAASVVDLWLNHNLLSDIRGSMFTGLDNLRTLMLRNNRLTCVGNHTFHGLSSVDHLSLYDNQIANVLSGAFTTMTSLNTLNLLSNQLDCNCHLAWMSTWLRRSAVASGNPRCEQPRNLRGLPVSDINPKDFRCATEAVEQSVPTCLPVRKCPKGCTCKNTIVRCGNRGLTSVPINDIPHDVTELYLERNSIREIPVSLKQFVFLKTLDLSNNQISSVSDWMFSNLTHLSTLILSYNRLRCIPPYTFAGLRSLKILSLHSNDLSTLPEGAFDDLTSLSNVGFGSNPWYCDCNLRWFANWVQAGNLEAGIARCTGPERMDGRLILASSLSSFVCQGPLDIAVAIKCNPCLTSPCRHNSTCRPHPTNHYQCNCHPGFKGRHCEMAIDPCILKPCMNGGGCRARDEVVYSCECRDGFEGRNCETNINDCASNPCTPSNATCVDGVNKYSCHCPTGWEGENCEREVKDVCSLLEPCLNGGTCMVVQEIDSTSYRCTCSTGYRGVNCSERFDTCLNHKCENGGRCEMNDDSPVGYQCHCQGEYSGQYCTVFPGESVDVLRDDPCSQHDCQNGAECYFEAGESDYQCRCLIGYSGKKCEKVLSISFHRNGSYVELPTSLGGMNRTNITLIFSTEHSNGVVLYNGDSSKTREHIALEFYSGHVRLSYDLGKFPGSTLYSQDAINDGRNHKIEVIIRNQMVSLKVDDGLTLEQATEAGAFSVLDIKSPLYAGGMSEEVLADARRMWHIRNATSFIGCIHSLLINEIQVDFVSALPDADDTRDVRPGCIREGQSGSCSAARCDHGQCIFTSDRGITCRCDEGFAGERCEISEAKRTCDSACVHGSCVKKSGSYQCQCHKGYTGKYCNEVNACSGVNCGRGTCVVGTNGYECKCKKRYTGRHCETRIHICPGKKIRQIYRVSRPTGGESSSGKSSTSCRSRKRFSNLICAGTCTNRRKASAAIFGQSDAAAATCCRPYRTQTKRVRMICDDGTKPIHFLQKVRRCACQLCT